MTKFINILLKGLLGGFFLSAPFWPLNANASELKIISDEETESFLAEIIKPLFDAAKLKFYSNNVYIVEDESLNAFISEGNKIFINTGTLMKADSANELSGVLAHETGHVMGGHILRHKIKSQKMQEISLSSLILAGAAAALSGNGDVAMAVLLGSNSSILNSYSNYRITEERAADEAAIKLLNMTNQSTEGMLSFMKKIKRENMLSGLEESTYFRSHPITEERIAFFENALKNNKKDKKISNSKFLRIRAKLKAFLQKPETTLNEYPLTKNDVNALYAQAIAYWKQLKFANAIKKIDEAINKENKNPFLYEVKGQILFDMGKISLAEKEFKTAYELLPQSHLMQINYAQAILENEPNEKKIKKAITLLQKSIIKKENAFSWQLLSKAYANINDMAGAGYAAAEYSYRIGNYKIAKKHLNETKKFNLSKQLQLKIDDLEKRLESLPANN